MASSLPTDVVQELINAFPEAVDLHTALAVDDDVSVLAFLEAHVGEYGYALLNLWRNACLAVRQPAQFKTPPSSDGWL